MSIRKKEDETMTNLKQSLIAICVVTATGFSAASSAANVQLSVASEQQTASDNQVSTSSNQASSNTTMMQSTQLSGSATTQNSSVGVNT